MVASGASMQEALDATKILAQDCRLKGTAFRLGVSVITEFFNVQALKIIPIHNYVLQLIGLISVKFYETDVSYKS